jgi:small subunit ribosomal protein S6
LVAQRLKDYELVMIVIPEATEDEVAAIIERVSSFITARGGEVAEQQTWGLRRLAYPIRKFMEGIYVLVRFSLEAQDEVALSRQLTASEDVLRHLVTKV